MKKAAVMFAFAVGAAGLFGAQNLRAEMFMIDAAHSDVGFSVRHMVVSKVRGSFSGLAGNFDYTENKPELWKASATNEIASINTNNSKRDEHLRNPDFFDAEKFPIMTFVGEKAEMKEGKYMLPGTLTMHGVAKPVTLEIMPGGVIKDMRGGMRAGFEAKTMINRKDFGLTYNKVLETGGVAVSEEVEISINIEGVTEKKMEMPKSEKSETPKMEKSMEKPAEKKGK